MSTEATSSPTALLELRDVNTHYGAVHILKDVNLAIYPGELVCLLGGNASGKTTTLKALLGMVTPTSGEVVLDGEVVNHQPISYRVANGVTMVPENRRLFKRLSVKENLMLGAYLRKDKDGIESDLEYVYDLFPRVKERINQKSGTLSGGEQQMVAIGRALMSRPKVLLMDEPSMGLAPALGDVHLHGRAERQHGPVDRRPRLGAPDRNRGPERHRRGAPGQPGDASRLPRRGVISGSWPGWLPA